MKVKPDKEQEYNHFVETSREDFYSTKAIDYMHQLANLMEQKLSKGAKLEDIAKDISSYTAYMIAEDAIYFGFIHGVAVHALYEYWVYGDELRALAEAGKI